MFDDKPQPHYATAFNRAVEIFGTEERARDWLEKMSAELGTAPYELLDSLEGLDRVMRHLRSVELALSLR